MTATPTVLVTGARKGIGCSLAEHLLERGWIVAGCSRGPGTIEHERYRHFEVDVTDESAVRKMFREFAKSAGGLDALINNAGRASMNHLLLTPTDVARDLMEVNYVGTMVCSREAARWLRHSSRARIVNTTTVAVPLNLEGEAAYAASKAAVESLTRVSARELGALGITVNAIGPTPIETDLIRGVPREKIEELVARQAISRLGRKTDVANVIDFFLDPESDFVTGQILYLGGV